MIIKPEIKSDYNNLNSRFNSHLTFNILNTLQSLILADEKEEAYRLVNAYSRMLREMMINGSRETTVRSELDIIIEYLELERIRMDEKFAYMIDVPKAVWETIIPKSLIISLVENAVKHGMRSLGKRGFVRIDCPEQEENIIRIRNNYPSNKLQRISGHGLELVKSLVTRHNRTFGTNIKMDNKDYTRKGEPGEKIFEVLLHF